MGGRNESKESKFLLYIFLFSSISNTLISFFFSSSCNSYSVFFFLFFPSLYFLLLLNKHNFSLPHLLSSLTFVLFIFYSRIPISFFTLFFSLSFSYFFFCFFLFPSFFIVFSFPSYFLLYSCILLSLLSSCRFIFRLRIYCITDRRTYRLHQKSGIEQ